MVCWVQSKDLYVCVLKFLCRKQEMYLRSIVFNIEVLHCPLLVIATVVSLSLAFSVNVSLCIIVSLY